MLDFIRDNVTLDRIRGVEKRLRDELDLNNYFDEVLMESVYRGHEGSYKIDISKSRGTLSLNLKELDEEGLIQGGL